MQTQQPSEVIRLIAEAMIPDLQYDGGLESNDGDIDRFDEEELLIAKRFIELVGGPERAKNLLDKVTDCAECLGILGDGDDAELNEIEVIGQSTPMAPDLPLTNLSAGLGVQSRYM